MARDMRLYIFALGLILMSSSTSVTAAQEVTTIPTPPVPSNFVPDGYHFVFGDEFEDTGLDTTKWEYRYANRPYLAGYSSEQSVVQPGDDCLHLVTTYQNDQFLTGMIQSVEHFQYGYFEARIRFQSLQGHHGAFWLQSPLYGQYPDDTAHSGAEIDVIEFFGSGRSPEDAQQNVYWNPYTADSRQQRSHNIECRQDYGDELSDDFHLFSLIWTSETYTFSIDGVETWHVQEGLSQTPEYVVLSLVTSEWENARLDKNKLPNEMLVDYVRVYAP